MTAEKQMATASLWPMAFALVLAAGLLAFGLYSGLGHLAKLVGDSEGRTLTVNTSPNPVLNIITVSAEASKDVNPDKAEMVFAVTNRGADPAQLQGDNDRTVNAIIASIRAMGVPAENIKTVGYSLDRWVEWNQSKQESVEKGYILTNRIRVVTYDVPQAGAILKAAVNNGANDVESVAFGLSDRLQKSTYEELLRTAAGQAGDKARAMASAAGVRVKRLGSMNEGYAYVQPLSNYNYKDAAMAGAPMPAALTPGLAKVTATVGASYEVE